MYHVVASAIVTKTGDAEAIGKLNIEAAQFWRAAQDLFALC